MTSRSNKKVLLIANPKAGSRWRRRKLPQVIEKLKRIYPSLILWNTSGMGDATRLAQLGVGEGFDLILCAGGDGTINEVVNGMIGSNIPLGIIPLGTGNGLVREIGLSTSPLSACEALEDPDVKTISVGKAGNRHFVLVAGAGIDSFTTEQIERHYFRLKRLIGPLSYFVIGFLCLFRYPYPTLSFTVDGQTYYGTSGAAAKANLMVGKIPITSIRLSEPDLCLCVIRGRGPIHYLAVAILFFITFGKVKIADYIVGKEIEIRSPLPLSYQVDGENCGALPLKIGVIPEALRLVYPKP